MRSLSSSSFFIVGLLLLPFILLGQSESAIGVDFIHIDQFGYYTNASKVAVLSNPQVGFNSSDSYTPSGTIELRDASDDSVVFSAAPSVWNGGATHDQSGDQGWWLDFSSYQTEGEYLDGEVIYQGPSNERSKLFFDVILRHPENTSFFSNFIINEQLPPR